MLAEIILSGKMGCLAEYEEDLFGFVVISKVAPLLSLNMQT